MARQQRFTEEEKTEIRTAHEAGVPYNALAEMHGVSSATIMMDKQENVTDCVRQLVTSDIDDKSSQSENN